MKGKKVRLKSSDGDKLYDVAVRAVVASGGFSGHPPPRIVGVNFSGRSTVVEATGVKKKKRGKKTVTKKKPRR